MKDEKGFMSKHKIYSSNAPQVLGAYSQAIQAGDIVYLSGQIPIDPRTATLVNGDIAAQTEQVFKNMKAVCETAGGTMNDIVKLTVYVIDLAHFSIINDIMSAFFKE